MGVNFQSGPEKEMEEHLHKTFMEKLVDYSSYNKFKKDILDLLLLHVVPSNVLDHVRSTVLTTAECQQVQEATNTQGNNAGVTLLFNMITKKSDWYNSLLSILSHEEVNLQHIAKLIKEEKSWTSLIGSEVQIRIENGCDIQIHFDLDESENVDNGNCNYLAEISTSSNKSQDQNKMIKHFVLWKDFPENKNKDRNQETSHDCFPCHKENLCYKDDIQMTDEVSQDQEKPFASNKRSVSLATSYTETLANYCPLYAYWASHWYTENEIKTPFTIHKKYSHCMEKELRAPFTKWVPSQLVLPVFHKYSHKVLTQTDMDNIDAELERRGKTEAARLLFDRLIMYEDWFSLLLKVLTDPVLAHELAHVAEKMKKITAPIREQYQKDKAELAQTIEKRLSKATKIQEKNQAKYQNFQNNAMTKL